MLRQFVRAVFRVLASMALGAALGALYAGLVGAIHLGGHGRWDRIPTFGAGCVLVGAVLGLLGWTAWVLSGRAARERSERRPPPGGSRPPESAPGTADGEETGRDRQRDRAGYQAAGTGLAFRPRSLRGLYRAFETRN